MEQNNLIILLLGIITGILIRDIKVFTLNKMQILNKNFKESFNPIKSDTKFFEPVTEEEKFKNAQSIDDLINK